MTLSTNGPYGDLFIYYLDGRLKAGQDDLGRDFIGNWQEDASSFLFFASPADAAVERLLARNPALKLLDHYQMAYDQWHGEPVVPFQVGRFLILPPWQLPGRDSLPPPVETTIILDPGVVFGTGTHATTHDCITALEIICEAHPPETVLDLGTGTGLLALAAAKLGCRRILAVDINFLAARTARANVRRNRLEDRILTIQGDAEKCIDLQSDLVVSNIHYDVMKHVIDSKGFLATKWFVLSGLLKSQARAVADKLAHYPVKIVRTWEREGIWHTFLGKMG